MQREPFEQTHLFNYDKEEVHDGAWRTDTNYPTEPIHAPVLIQVIGVCGYRYEIGFILDDDICIHMDWADGSAGPAVANGLMRWILLADVHKILKETK